MSSMTYGKYNRKWLRLARVFYPLASLILFLFPALAKYILKRSLKNVKGVHVSVASLSFTPFAFKVIAKGILIQENTARADAHVYFSADALELQIEPGALWHGEVIASITCTTPFVSILQKVLSNVKVAPGNPLLRLNIGMDVTLRKVEIIEGKITYTGASSETPFSVTADRIELIARDISTLPAWSTNAALNIRAHLYGGVFEAAMSADLLSRTPDFVLDTDIRGVNMVLLNDFFQKYGRFDVSSGTMNMHSEVKAMSGKFGGYVESVIEDLHVLGPEDKGDNILRYLWEGLVGLMLDVLKDHRTDELKTCINFEKPFKDPEVHVGVAVREVLANAFVHGLTPYLRNEVKINL